MSQMTITIKNESGVPRRFLLFQDIPKPNNGPSSSIFTNVYQRSPKIQSGDNAMVTFTMKNEYFAMYGTSSNNDDGTVRVYTSASVPCKLGPGGTVAVVSTFDGEGEDPTWDPKAAAGQSTSANGGFSIVTDTSFRYRNSSKFLHIAADMRHETYDKQWATNRTQTTSTSAAAPGIPKTLGPLSQS
jgi:hypothetical protein